VLCIQYAEALNRFFCAGISGILWNVPNDLFNRRQRTLYHEQGVQHLRGGDFAAHAQTIALGSWANVDGKIGIAAAQPLTLVRSGKRQVDIKGRSDSGTLYAEEICAPYSAAAQWHDRGEVLIDTAFAMTLGRPEATQALDASLTRPELPGFKTVSAVGRDGKRYVLAANFTQEAQMLHLAGKDAAVAPGEAMLVTEL